MQQLQLREFDINNGKNNTINFQTALSNDVYFSFIFGFQIFEVIFSADLDVLRLF